MRVAILCASDSSFRGTREDLSTPTLRGLVEAKGWQVIEAAILPDDLQEIRGWLIRACEELQADLILTTGGTGLGPRDVTPEATQVVIERLVPGIPEAMRALTLAKTPYAMLSRGIAGTRGCCLIVNFPGSPKAVRECFEAVEQALSHAVDVIRGGGDHSSGERDERG